MKFVDRVKVYLRAGSGGNGCVSFYRARHIAKGGPDGGNGGNGGSIIFKATNQNNSLIAYQYKPHIYLPAGIDGKSQNRHGKNGEDRICTVPPGTQIWNADRTKLLADLEKIDDEYLAVKGGIGGHGNDHFKTATNQSPDYATQGTKGQELDIWLELKVIADIGIIGFPNAGKSSLLRNISRATPEVANYPFTTLTPQLGRAVLHEKTLVLADIPGLIENAHLGKGLGHRFLAHIERCQALLHLIDGNTEDIAAAYKQIRYELGQYSPKLLDKKEIIGITKIDTMPEEKIQEQIEKLKDILKDSDVIAISNISKKGVDELMKICFDKI